MVSKAANSGLRGHFRHAVGAGQVNTAREHGAHARPLDHLPDQRRVGGYDQLVHQTMLLDALDDPGDQRFTGQHLERFVGESG